MEHFLGLRSFIFPFMEDGSKDLEVRLCVGKSLRIAEGDTILFNGCLRRLVKKFRQYPSFEDMLQHEDTNRILPGHSPIQILVLLRGFYEEAAERRHGVVVFELVPVQ